MISCVKMVAVFLLVATTLLLVTFDSIDAGGDSGTGSEGSFDEAGHPNHEGDGHDDHELDTGEDGSFDEAWHGHHEGDGHDHEDGDLDEVPLEDASGQEPTSGEAHKKLKKLQDDELDGSDSDDRAEADHKSSLIQRLRNGERDFVHETCTHGVNKDGKVTHRRIKSIVSGGKQRVTEMHHFVEGEATGVIKRITNKHNAKGKIVRKTVAHIIVKNGKKGHVHVHETNGKGKKLKGPKSAAHIKEVKAKMNAKIRHAVKAGGKKPKRKPKPKPKPRKH